MGGQKHSKLRAFGWVVCSLFVAAFLILTGISIQSSVAGELSGTKAKIEPPAWQTHVKAKDGTLAEKPRVYRDALDDEGKAAYDEIEITLRTMSSSCSIQGLGYAELRNAYLAVVCDNPDIFWCTSYMYVPDVLNSGSFVFVPIYGLFASFDDVKAEHDDYMRQMEEIAAGILDYSQADLDKGLVELSAREVCSRLHYGRNFGDQTIKALFGKYGGQTVCAGYAKSFCLLCAALNIECYYVEGTTGTPNSSHAWNMLRVGDVIWWADLTWGDEGDFVEKYYLTANGKEFSKRHEPNAAVRQSRIFDDGEFQKMVSEALSYRNVFNRSICGVCL